MCTIDLIFDMLFRIQTFYLNLSNYFTTNCVFLRFPFSFLFFRVFNCEFQFEEPTFISKTKSIDNKTKMSDSIKFGPEWLRNMSNDTNSLSSSSATSSGAGGGGGGGGGGLSTYSNSRMYSFIYFFFHL